MFVRNGTKNSGFALTEVLLAIAVIVIIGIVSYPLYKNAQTSSKVEEMANTLAILSTNAQTLKQGQSNFNQINIVMMDWNGMVPDEIKPIASSMGTNPWGGFVNLTPTQDWTGLAQNTGFMITVTNIPSDSCVKLVNRVAPSFLTILDAHLEFIKDTTTNKVDVLKLTKGCEDPTVNAIMFSAR